ncbi:MAG TPA: branched-chain amino acid ABC transporter permease [Ktedonobacteraceae bacterium]|jgi:branched-chain amino acid transport system permease protein|nr:branched-chain amino acid ABC transporter permease [Ktedonobacteraceae bacterium]
MNMIRVLKVPAFLLIMTVFPLVFSDPAVTTIAVLALILASAAVGWNIFSGYSGYISLGYAAFHGTGAYILVLMCQEWKLPGGFQPFFLLPLVGLLTGICALPLGWIALKTQRYTFIVMTIAIYALVSQLPSLFSSVIPGLSEETLPIPLWNGVTFNMIFYYMAFALLLLALGVSWWIRQSKYGLSLRAIRDDEERLRGLGVKVLPVKLSAFMISACFAGMVGALHSYFLGFATPVSAFDRTLNVSIPLMAFLGGLGTFWGPVSGGLLVVVLEQNLTLQFGTQGLDIILYGVMFLIVMLLMPEGMLPTLSKWWITWSKARLVQNSESEPALSPIAGELAITSGKDTPLPTTSLPVTPFPTTPFTTNVTPDVAHVEPQAQEIFATNMPYEQASAQPRVSIPRRPADGTEPTGHTLKVRALRLTTVSATKQASSSSGTSGPLVGWSCPRCGEALWIWGEAIFCRKCGFKHTIAHKRTQNV